MRLVDITIRGKKLRVAASSKADVARALLDHEFGFTVSEISKAVPMAYSQVHSIAKTYRPSDAIREARQENVAYHTGRKLKPREGDKPGAKVITGGRPPVEAKDVTPRPAPKRLASGKYHSTGRQRLTEEEAGQWTPPERAKDRPKKPKLAVSPRVGKLRTPGQPNDTAVGECINCGYDLAVRPLPTGYTLIHINMSAEEYLATIQFCMAVPKSLVA